MRAGLGAALPGGLPFLVECTYRAELGPKSSQGRLFLQCGSWFIVDRLVDKAEAEKAKYRGSGPGALGGGADARRWILREASCAER